MHDKGRGPWVKLGAELDSSGSNGSRALDRDLSTSSALRCDNERNALLELDAKGDDDAMIKIAKTLNYLVNDSGAPARVVVLGAPIICLNYLLRYVWREELENEARATLHKGGIRVFRTNRHPNCLCLRICLAHSVELVPVQYT